MIEAIGIIGAVFTLFAFYMLQSDKWDSHSRTYDAINFASGVLLAIYAFDGQVWPFFVINIVWAAVALRDLLRKSSK